jgi:DNA-directed RNA polymerase subunit RPC12/RpoP
MNHQPEEKNESEDVITLRCNKCGKPITPAEAVQTPIGYRCQDCVRRQQKVFDTSKPTDYVVGFIISGVLSFLASLLVSVVGFFIFLLAPAAGVGIAEVVRLVIKKRRSKRLFKWITYGIIAGAIPLIGLDVISLFLRLSTNQFSLFSLVPVALKILYLILAVPSAYYRLSGSRRP